MIKSKTIFNPKGNDSIKSRKVIGGNTSNIINLNNIKYSWALKLYKQMRENFWIPDKVDLSMDVVDYKNLTAAETRAYNGQLSFLIFLDSIQVKNLPIIEQYLTAPEINICLAEQQSQEAMHAHAYSVMVETIVDKEDRDIIWDYWRKDKVLNKRCEHIAKAFEAFISNPNDQTFFESVIADYVLEGLYFYQGFIYFYNLASRSLMCGTADMIRYINKDETLHVALYQQILKELPYSTDHGNDWIYNFFEKATELDIKWNQYIIGNDILGITNNSIDKYSKYLCNKRLKGIGLKPIYAEISNPYKHLEKLATDTVKTNFFDGTVTTYSQSTALEGWDF